MMKNKNILQKMLFAFICFSATAYAQTGKVGINTTTPQATLEVLSRETTSNAMKITANSITTGKALDITTPALTTGSALSITSASGRTNSNGILKVTNTVASDPGNFGKFVTLQANSAAGSGLNIINNGNVGIGVNIPTTRFEVVEGDLLTRMDFWGTDNLLQLKSSSTSNWARIGSSASPLAFVTTGGDKSSSAPSMFINNNGNVGIGTTSPSKKLTIGGTGQVFGVDNTAVFDAKNTSGNYETFFWPRWSDNTMYMNYGANGFNIRNNSSSSTMFMTNAGRVGIGTTSPSKKLDINGDLRIASTPNASNPLSDTTLMIDSGGNVVKNANGTVRYLLMNENEGADTRSAGPDMRSYKGLIKLLVRLKNPCVGNDGELIFDVLYTNGRFYYNDAQSMVYRSYASVSIVNQSGGGTGNLTLFYRNLCYIGTSTSPITFNITFYLNTQGQITIRKNQGEGNPSYYVSWVY